MRQALLLVTTILLGAAMVRAEGPATRPSESQSILVLPFVAPPGRDFEWIGKGIQQNLIAELSPDVRGAVIWPAAAQATDDAAAALKSARDNKTAVVIFGSAQVIDKEIRLTGQVLDVATGKTLGSLKATGALDDLFRLQDLLAGQAVQALPRPLLKLRGLAAARQYSRPQIIQLPGDQPTPYPSYGPMGSGPYSPLYTPLANQAFEAPAPPYSPYGYTYPYRFYYPYYPLFSYGSGFRADGLFPFPLGFSRNFDDRPRPSPHRDQADRR